MARLPQIGPRPAELPQNMSCLNSAKIGAVPIALTNLLGLLVVPQSPAESGERQGSIKSVLVKPLAATAARGNALASVLVVLKLRRSWTLFSCPRRGD